jgi:lysophospholipase L1-like esterase
MAIPALIPFHAALANRASSPVNIVCMGDSTVEGTGVGTTQPDRAKSWPDRLAELLRQRFPTVGESAVQAPNFQPVNTTSPIVTGVTKSGFGASSTQYGPHANAARSTTAGDTLTFSTAHIPIGTTAVDVFGLGGTSVTGWTYAFDGGAASGTQTVSGSTRDGTTVRLTSPNSAAAHSLVLTTVGANNYIHGLLTYAGNESKGIRVFNGAKHGARLNQYVQGGSYNWLQANQSATVLGGAQSLIALNPDLLILGYGFNDFTNGDSPTTFKTNLTNLIAGLRSVLPTKLIPVVLVGDWEPNTTNPSGYGWNDYLAAMVAVAAADPYATFVSLGERMPNVASPLATTLALYSDTQHATAKGYQMVADELATLIEP